MPLTKEEVSISIGKVIRELRQSQNLTIEELANKTGIEYSQLSRIERGKINTSAYHIYIIIRTLNVPINTIFKTIIQSIRNKK